MGSTTTIIATAAVAISRALEQYGGDAPAIFRAAGLDPDKMYEPNARYPIIPMRRVWQAAAHASGDPCFGLTVAEFATPTSFHALGFSWLASHTLHEAMTRLVRYHHIMSTGSSVALERHVDEYGLVFTFQDLTTDPVPYAFDAYMGGTLKLCRMLCGEDFAPTRINMQRREPGQSHRFAAFFGAPVQFSAPDNTLFVDKQTALWRQPTGNQELARANDEIASGYLAGLDRNRFSNRVRSTLIQNLPTGEPSQQAIARELATSVRTLQRKLRGESTTYKQLLDETRQYLAIRYVKQGRFAVGEIAYLLGFSEPSNFSRAFKRWTGSAPRDFKDSA